MKNLMIFILFFAVSFSVYAKIPKNFGIVIPNVYRGGILTKKSEYGYLKDIGVNTVISLEYFHRENERFCEMFNFDCQRYSILQLPYQDISIEQLKRAYRATLIAVYEGKIVYIHCFGGRDRTGALSSALIIRDRSCEKQYDPDLLMKEVVDTLHRYKFNRWLFPHLYWVILGWVKNPPEWICD